MVIYCSIFIRLFLAKPWPIPGLESPAETSARVEALAQDVLDAATAEEVTPVLFVTHSKVLEAVLAKVFGSLDGKDGM